MKTWMWIALGVGAVYLLTRKKAVAPPPSGASTILPTTGEVVSAASVSERACLELGGRWTRSGCVPKAGA